MRTFSLSSARLLARHLRTALAVVVLAFTASAMHATAGNLADAFSRLRIDGVAVAPRALPAVTTSAGGIVEVVEYYNATLKHFFITADPAEKASLDGGAFGGVWQRTGGTFPAWDLAGAAAGTVPGCRFFGTDQYRANGTRIGPNSHFYTADPAECAFVKTAYQSVAANGVSYPAWTYESNAFAVMPPVGGDACPGGSRALFRAYNNGANGDPNHRYSLNAALLQNMAGWSFEGLVMCVPAGQPVVLPPSLPGCGAGCPDDATKLGNGIGLVNVVVTVSNPGPSPAEINIPAGGVFSSSQASVQASADDTFQNGIMLEGALATIAPGTTSTFLLQLFCLNQTLAPSTSGSTYSYAGPTDNAPLLELAAMVDGKLGKGLDRFGLKANATQYAVWVITDGAGSLTATQKGLLAAMYAATDDLTLVELYEQFLATLPQP